MSDPPQERAAPADPRFLVVAGVLLLAIIAILAVLWLRAHRWAVAAERRVAELQPYADAQALGQPYLKDLPVYLSVPREELATRPVKLDGRQAVALRLPTGLGKVLGFKPGDVILVDEAATTTTAASPATGAGE